MRRASFSYSSALPKLASVTYSVTQSVTYDAAGNETAVGTSAMTISTRNEVTAVDGLAYLYDGRGVRTTTSQPALSLKRHSLYTPEMSLLSETEVTSATTPAIAYDYVWFAGKPIAQIDLATNTPHWTFTDHLGTPILQTNAGAAIDGQVEHEPDGEVYTYRTGSTRHQPLRFPGQEYDVLAPDRDAGVGDDTPDQTSILTACYPGFAP